MHTDENVDRISSLELFEFFKLKRMNYSQIFQHKAPLLYQLETNIIV